MFQLNDFSDVEHRWLKAYNRSAFYHNLKEDFGLSMSSNYLDLFSQNEIADMKLVTDLVKKLGTKKVLGVITKNMEFPEYMPEAA